MAVRPIFMESVEFADRITEMYEFVWPTAAAMWNLRWQVRGFMAVHPNAGKKLLHARFVEGSGIRGENLERACIEYDWARQKDHFARIVLVNLFAHYEEWCKAIVERFAVAAEVEKDLQFWERTANGKVRRFTDAVRTLGSQPSPIMATTFGPPYTNQSRYAAPRLEALLRCVRFFKELRNCVAHQGARASQRLMDAYTQWLPFATAAQMGVNEVPRHTSPVLSQRCDVDLRGVVGMGNVLLLIVETVDADLAGTKQAELAFAERWRKRHGQVTLKSNPASIQTQFNYAMGQLGLHRVAVTPEFIAFMRANALVI